MENTTIEEIIYNYKTQLSCMNNYHVNSNNLEGNILSRLIEQSNRCKDSCSRYYQCQLITTIDDILKTLEV